MKALIVGWGLILFWSRCYHKSQHIVVCQQSQFICFVLFLDEQDTTTALCNHYQFVKQEVATVEQLC